MANGLDLVMLPMTEAIGEEGGRRARRARPAPSRRASTSSSHADSRRSASACRSSLRAEHGANRTAYNITKGVVEHIDKFQSAHRLLKKVVTLQTLAEPGAAPFHPGAAKYLKEKGLLK